MTRVHPSAQQVARAPLTRSQSAHAPGACGQADDHFVRGTTPGPALDVSALPAGWTRLVSFDGAAFAVPRPALVRSDSFFSSLVRHSGGSGASRQHLVDVGSEDLYHMINFMLYDVAPPCSGVGAERFIALAEAKCLMGLAKKLRFKQLNHFLQLRPTLNSPVAAAAAQQAINHLRAQANLHEKLASGFDVLCCPILELQDCYRIASKRGACTIAWETFTQNDLTAYGSTRWPQERREQVEDGWQWLTTNAATYGVALGQLCVVTAEQPFKQAGFSVGGIFAIRGIGFRASMSRA